MPKPQTRGYKMTFLPIWTHCLTCKILLCCNKHAHNKKSAVIWCSTTDNCNNGIENGKTWDQNGIEQQKLTLTCLQYAFLPSHGTSRCYILLISFKSGRQKSSIILTLKHLQLLLIGGRRFSYNLPLFCVCIEGR